MSQWSNFATTVINTDVSSSTYQVNYGGPLNQGVLYYWMVRSNSPLTSYSNVASFTTNVIDSDPPSRYKGSPSGTLVSGTTQVNMTLLTNENATCRYSALSGTAYQSRTGGFTITGALTHSRTMTGLTDGSSYTYYIKCIDASGNYNTDDYPIYWNIASSVPSAPIVLPVVSNGVSISGGLIQ